MKWSFKRSIKDRLSNIHFSSWVLPGIQIPKQKPRRFRCSPGAVTQTKQEARFPGGGQIPGLKSQVLSDNEGPTSPLPQPLSNKAITVVTQENCQNLEGTVGCSPGQMIAVNAKRSASRFQSKVPVTSGKQFLRPLAPNQTGSASLKSISGSISVGASLIRVGGPAIFTCPSHFPSPVLP